MCAARLIIVLAVGAALSACIDQSQPRSFTEFMDDSIAREGTLVRCNADRAATANDLECINARRAASAIAAQAESERREQLEAASESQRRAVRRSYDAQQAAARHAQVVAQIAEQDAYESQWDESLNAEPAVATAADQNTATMDTSGSSAPVPALDFITLPRSAAPPLTTIALPRRAKPLQYVPPPPVLQEIVLPSRARLAE
jgi:hypothetical protein